MFSPQSDEEEAILGELYLPRNLSYDEGSYLDDYSVSSSFVHSKNKRLNHKNTHHVISSIMAEMKRSADMAADTSKSEHPHQPGCDFNSDKKCIETGSDANSEEGVFVNMDDLDIDSSTCRSNDSGDFSIDSINSPDDNDLVKSSEGCNAGSEGSLGEELCKAVANMAVSCPVTSTDEKSSPTSPLKLKINDKFVNTDGLSEFGSERSFLDLYTAHDSPTFPDEEFNFDRAELRKSSSLKTNKTPPGTPRRKKMVRFADAMGLDLEDVRHVLNIDAPPKIPASAMADLKVGIEEDRKEIGSRYLTGCFEQPGACENFLQKVMAQKVCLENAVITNLTVTGVVRVANIGLHKSVRIRYTTNNWIGFHDIMASYVQNSCDGPTDRFSFSICAPADFGVNSKLQFAISYSVNDNMYWDNNNGNNYVLECFAKTTPTEAETSWVHFL